MSKPKKDLTGQLFGNYTVIKLTRESAVNYRVFWLCRCSCGTNKVVRQDQLIAGFRTSCGCGNKKTVYDPIKPEVLNHKKLKAALIAKNIARRAIEKMKEQRELEKEFDYL